jgi:predicted PurR-regulated permease PerM
MNFSRTSIIWIAAAVTGLALAVLLREVLLPFLVGVTVAYLLNPVVSRLERTGMARSVAALGIIGLFYAAVTILVVMLTPVLIDEVASFIEKFPGYLSRLQGLATDPSRPWLRDIISQGLDEARQSTGELTQLGANVGSSLLHILWSDGQAVISALSLLVVAPIVAYYVLVDWDQILATLGKLPPPPRRAAVQRIGREINQTVAAFLHGQGIICLILAVYYAVALRLTGLNHAYSIGLLSGLVSFAPYLGLLTGLVLSIGVALIQFWPSWTIVPVILGVFLLGQAVADYALAPRLIGDRLKLSPLLMMFSVAAFGYLFGFVGLLIAVPLAAAIGVVLRFVIEEEFVHPAEAAPPPAPQAETLPRKKRGWSFPPAF